MGLRSQFLGWAMSRCRPASDAQANLKIFWFGMVRRVRRQADLSWEGFDEDGFPTGQLFGSQLVQEVPVDRDRVAGQCRATLRVSMSATCKVRMREGARLDEADDRSRAVSTNGDSQGPRPVRTAST